MTPAYRTGAELIGVTLFELTRRDAPARFVVPPPFESLDLRPGRLVLLGGAPGQGKTALLLHLLIDLLRGNRTVNALVANVEMSPEALFERALARLASVPLGTVGDRAPTDDELERLTAAARGLVPVVRRTAVLCPPFDLRHVAAAATEFEAGVVVLDYLQRFTAGNDQREALDGLMGGIRRICDAGALVLAAAAVARQKTKSGSSSYQDLNLASFRGSSELEFGADACYVLEPAGGEAVTLKCLKNRYAEPRDVHLRFDRAHQRFDPWTP